MNAHNRNLVNESLIGSVNKTDNSITITKICNTNSLYFWNCEQVQMMQLDIFATMHVWSKSTMHVWSKSTNKCIGAFLSESSPGHPSLYMLMLNSM